MAIIIVEPEKASSRIRSQINELLYLLQTDAQKNREIELLIRERDVAIREAYNFTYGVVTWDREEFSFIKDVSTLAGEAIAIRERYEKRLKRCTVKHKRFKTIVDNLLPNERETFLKAFCTDIEVDGREVKLIIKKYYTVINRYYPEAPTDVIEKLLKGGENL